MISTDSTSLHGVFLVINKLGVVIQAPSGTGKSEIALNFIAKGHQLVADDVILLQAYGQEIIGLCPSPIQDMLEIRGLGPIHIPSLYGKSAIRSGWRIDFLIQLVNNDHPVLHENRHQGAYFLTKLLDVPIRSLYLPEKPACGLVTLIDCAVRCEVKIHAKRSGQKAPEVATIESS